MTSSDPPSVLDQQQETDESQAAAPIDALETPSTTLAATRMGVLPSLAVYGACGLLLIAFSDSAARGGADWAEPLFWIGLLVMLLPTAVRLASSDASRGERLGLVVLFGFGLYLVKVLQSPEQFTFHDEFLHWRTANDIALSHHLFSSNPLLPVSAFYPGLENVTSAAMSVSGLSIFGAGVVVAAIARITMIVALFLLFEEISDSPRLAAVATLLYSANPNFLFFDAQFSYESLALPFAVITLYLMSRRAHSPHGQRAGLTVAALLTLLATATTHHITGFALATFLLLWTVLAVWRHRRGEQPLAIAWMALLAVALVVAWVVFVAQIAIGYLSPILSGGVVELIQVIGGQASLHHLFSDSSGQSSAIWERLVGFGAVGLVLAGLPYGLLKVWQCYRGDALALSMAAGTLVYPATLALRLTQRGTETSNRASEFLFLPIAFVLAVGAEELWKSRVMVWRRPSLVAGWLGVLFLGGVIIGWAPWGRLPGSYLVAADSRSIEPQGVDAAGWMLAQLGPGNRMAADRTNGLLMGSYGQQRIVSAFVDDVGVWPLYFSSTVGPFERATLHRGQIRYLVVDRRLATALPRVGVYIELGEQDAFQHIRPIPVASLTKFDRLAGASRLFDSGDIVIYDLGGVAGAQ